MRSGEAGLLSAFDTNRELIYATISKVHTAWSYAQAFRLHKSGC
jgi:hypothetical protein